MFKRIKTLLFCIKHIDDFVDMLFDNGKDICNLGIEVCDLQNELSHVWMELDQLQNYVKFKEL